MGPQGPYKPLNLIHAEPVNIWVRPLAPRPEGSTRGPVRPTGVLTVPGRPPTPPRVPVQLPLGDVDWPACQATPDGPDDISDPSPVLLAIDEGPVPPPSTTALDTLYVALVGPGSLSSSDCSELLGPLDAAVNVVLPAPLCMPQRPPPCPWMRLALGETGSTQPFHFVAPVQPWSTRGEVPHRRPCHRPRWWRLLRRRRWPNFWRYRPPRRAYLGLRRVWGPRHPP